MAATPFTVDGKVVYPNAPGVEETPRPFSMLSNFTSKTESVLALDAPGSATYSAPSPGARFVLVIFEDDPAQPAEDIISVSVNSGAVVELSRGGFLLLSSPLPDAGVTQVDITYTVTGSVRVVILA